MTLTAKAEVPEEKLVTVPLFPPKIPQELT